MERIREALQNRFDEALPEFHSRRIIFWQDEECGYADSIGELELEGVTVIVVDETNNFSVKKLLNEDDTEGNYLIYSTVAYEDMRDDWLYDIRLYSEEFRADIHSQRMNEIGAADSPSMRNVVKDYAKFFENKERMKKLIGLGREYSNPTALQLDIFGVLCNVNSGDVKDIIIAVLCKGFNESDNAYLEDITKFARIEKFWDMVGKYTGYQYEEGKDNLKLLATTILITAVSTTMNAAALKGLETFIADGYEQRCFGLVDEWMHSRRDDDLYQICRKVEAELGLEKRFDNRPVEELLESECFPCINECILRKYFGEINEQVIKTDSIISTVQKRRTRKWYKRVQHYYEGILQIAKMQDFRNRYAAGFHIVEPEKIWQLYTDELYEIDTCYRKFHLAFGKAIKESTVSLEDEYKKAADYIENIYKNWFLNDVLAMWVNAARDQLGQNGYIQDVDRQLDFYKDQVVPASDRSIVFVIISDALRYEVAAELLDRLDRNHRGKVELTSMQGVFPTITSYGMAALLPGKHKYFKDTAVYIEDIPSVDNASREKILKKENPNSTAIQYEKFLAMKKEERQELIKGMEVVYIYHNAIDAKGENRPTETEVFEACEDAIVEISNLVQTIIGLRASSNIIVTADHGFLYTYNPLPEGDKFSVAAFADKEKTERRFVISRTPIDSPFLLPVKMGINNENDGFSAYSPLETIRFKAGGGDRYVHGGASLQEMVVPVINFRSVRADSREYKKQQDEYITHKAPLMLVGTNRKITNNIFSLKFYQSEAVGTKVAPATYEIYMTDIADNIISDVSKIVADRTSEDEHERQFSVTMNLKPLEFNKTDLYSLVIADEDGHIVTKEDYTIDITFSNDFDF